MFFFLDVHVYMSYGHMDMNRIFWNSWGKSGLLYNHESEKAFLLNRFDVSLLQLRFSVLIQINFLCGYFTSMLQ